MTAFDSVYIVSIKMKNSTKMTATEIQIVTLAIAMLRAWDWSTGEPLSALSRAAAQLGYSNAHAEIANIGKLEREFAANGALWNNCEARIASLGAVLRFQGQS